MYLRQSNKWKEYVLQEAIEDIGLSPEVTHYLRQQNEEYGPVANKALTWLGNLIKAHRSQYFVSANTIQTIQDDIVPYEVFPKTPEGEEAARKAYNFFDEWHYNHSGTRGSPSLGDMKSLKKNARRKLKKLGVKPSVIKQLNAYLDNRMMRAVQSLKQFYAPIMQVLAEDPAAYDELREEIIAARVEPWQALRAANYSAREILESPAKAEEQVIHTFDNGYFWYDIRSSACDFEGRKMGHCGQGNQGLLYSLRSGDKRRNIKPMITLEMDQDGTVYQIKAKANQAPREDLWPYIDWFIENADVKRVAEQGMHSSDGLGFAEMLGYLKQKHPDVKFEDSWVEQSTEVLEQYAPSMASDSQTSQEVYWASLGDEEVSFLVLHQAFWPVKDSVIASMKFDDLLRALREDAHFIAEKAFNLAPRIRDADFFPRGVQDSQAAMLRIELTWSEAFRPSNTDDPSDVAAELDRLTKFLGQMEDISAYLVSPNAAPEEAKFDYNVFWEGIQERLEKYGVYRDVAGEIDAEELRWRAERDSSLQESRVIQRWAKIIK